MHDPPEYENVALQSRWSIGLKTPLLMVGSFVLAFLVAALHAIFYKVLTDTPADGLESRVPQTYVTTISVILSSTFTLLIHFCLGLSFTQYLWFILRRQPLATLTIEHIFTLRSNPLSLFDRTVFRRAYPLVLIAVISWSVSIAMSFPPGAITIVPSLQEILVPDAFVPTFNASNFEYMSKDVIDENSLLQLGIRQKIDGPEGDLYLSLDYNLTSSALSGLIRRTLLTKHVEDASSTCSANCSYSLHFPGPYIQCTSTTNTSTIHGPSVLPDGFPIFNLSTEQWPIEYTSIDDPKLKDSQLQSHITISTTTLQNYGLMDQRNEIEDNEILAREKIDLVNHYLTCTPSRADYNVHTIYKDSARSLEVNIDKSSIEPLISGPPSNVFIENQPDGYYSTPDFDSAFAPILRDANLHSIITAVVETISGSFKGSMGVTYVNEDDPTDSEGFTYHNFTTLFPSDTEKDFMAYLPIAQYFSDTPISPSFSTISVKNGGSGIFTINETSINNMLQDVVLSIISYQANNWTTKVDQTRTESRNVYTFSRPLNLFLPYGLMLLGSLCTMILGFYALRSNGVPATDGGFLQLFTTAQRSDTVDRIARGGCLGGEENVSTSLKDLKIQFGELVKTTDVPEIEVFSTAGFGTEHEIRPLKRERIYGSL